MARLVAGGLSWQRSDDPARVAVSIVARELDDPPNATGSMTYVDTSNRNYGIHVDCLRISDDGNRIIFSGKVDMTTVDEFDGKWLLSMWENIDGVWGGTGNWSDAHPGCDRVPPSLRYEADAGAVSILPAEVL